MTSSIGTQYNLAATTTGSASDPSAFDLPAGDGSYLTPDALMLYCQSRLQSIDTQMQAGINEQQNNTDEQTAVNELVADFQKLSAHGTTDPNSSDPTKNATNYAQCQDLEEHIRAVIHHIQTTDPGSPAIAKLMDIHDRVMATGTQGYTDSSGNVQTYYGPTPDKAQPDGIIDVDEINQIVNDLKDVGTTLNSSAELNMIQLQSYMSQRQTAIQLTTNLVQSLGDQDNKIVSNIGH
jgi:hypothetical protein